MSQLHEKKGILFIISAPSGAGKTTLVKALVARDPKLMVSVSYTTRPKRSDEIDDVSYHFVTEKPFKEMVSNNDFLEYAKVFDYHYATGRRWVEDKLANGIDIILEIDWQGAQQVRQHMDNTVNLFILPPSFQSLADRLHSRGEENELVQRRMVDAVKELSHYKEFDYIIVNEDFEFALQELKSVIRAKRHNYALQTSFFDEFAQQLLEQAENS